MTTAKTHHSKHASETLTAEEKAEQEFLSKEVEKESAKKGNPQTFTMTSTTEAELSPEDFWRIKLAV